MISNTTGCELLRAFGAEWGDLILTSPPYDNQRGTEFNLTDALRMIAASYYALKEGGTLVWVVADGHKDGADSLSSFKHATLMNQLGFRVNVQIYRILNPKPNAQRQTPTKDFEYILVGHKGRPKTAVWPMVPSKYAGVSTGGSNGRQDGYKKAELRTIQDMKRHTTTWEYTVGSAYGTDATPFPLELAIDFIKMYSSFGDMVVDPMCGSGTVGVASYVLNRKFRGSDINPDRVAESMQAIEDAKAGLYEGAPCPECLEEDKIYRGKDGTWKSRCKH